jgi:DNA repair exonuclease SbcCD ATPase subunit
MKLLSFTWNNIFSLGKGSLCLDDRGLTLVTGFSEDEGSSNGAGKSSLANKAILWVLYGQTAGGLRADAIVNRHGKKSGWGEIAFHADDGTLYTVRRARPAKLTLMREDTDISAKKATETQLLIDQALGQSFQTFIQANMFGQGRTLSYASLPGAEQKKVLEQILPIQTLDQTRPR